MNRKTKAAAAILFACLTLTAGLASGQAEKGPPFLTVFVWKDGDWGKDECIKLFPDPVAISTSAAKKPNKIRWVILDKGANEWSVDLTGKYDWSIEPKTAGDALVPPLAKKIKKGQNAFSSGKPGQTGTWKYKIILKEDDPP